MTYISHLTYILSNAAQSPQKRCFILPQFEPGTDENEPHRKIIGWEDVTYGKFLEDINLCATYFIDKFQCPPGSTIGLWFVSHIQIPEKKKSCIKFHLIYVGCSE